MQRWLGAGSLWRNRDFVLLWSGQTVSITGSSVAGISLPLLVLQLTHSPAQLGIIDALLFLPYPALTLIAGVLVDRWDRRKTMVWCDTGRAVLAGSIPVTLVLGHLSIVQLCVVALLSGSLFVFFDLAAVSSLPRVVPSEQLGDAIGKNQAAAYTAGLAGPPLGGLLFQIWSVLPFIADAGSYAASVVSLLFVRTPLQGDRTSQPLNLRTNIAAGAAWLWQQPLFRFMTGYSAALNLAIANSGLILIVLSRELHASPPALGAMFSAAGLGGILGSALAPQIQRRTSYGGALIGTSWLVAAMWLLYAAVPSIVVIAVANGLLALVHPTIGVVGVSYRLAQTPESLQGRVNSVIRLIAFGTPPLGAAAAGLLLQRFGGRPTVLIFGAWLVALSMVLTVNPDVRHAPPLPETPPN